MAKGEKKQKEGGVFGGLKWDDVGGQISSLFLRSIIDVTAAGYFAANPSISPSQVPDPGAGNQTQPTLRLPRAPGGPEIGESLRHPFAQGCMLHARCKAISPITSPAFCSAPFSFFALPSCFQLYKTTPLYIPRVLYRSPASSAVHQASCMANIDSLAPPLQGRLQTQFRYSAK